jgi:hypothetical protein
MAPPHGCSIAGIEAVDQRSFASDGEVIKAKNEPNSSLNGSKPNVMLC